MELRLAKRKDELPEKDKHAPLAAKYNVTTKWSYVRLMFENSQEINFMFWTIYEEERINIYNWIKVNFELILFEKCKLKSDESSIFRDMGVREIKSQEVETTLEKEFGHLFRKPQDETND